VKQIVILISGRGSNMQAIVRACVSEGWNARVAAVVSNRADAQGLEFARQHGIATAVVDHKTFASREAFDAELAQTIEGFAPDVVALAGFMRILTDGFVARFEGRLVNVHPSLLPSFTGLHTHRRAIEAGCKLAGATAHFVTPTLDHGPIIAQAWVPVLPGDTPELLSARVLKREHVLYPRAVRWLVHDLLTLADGVVTQVRGESQLL
jgi:phosphoribosylglycinamide formyltransferase-1